MVATYQYIGKAVPRVDGFLKVTGQATYAGDVNLPGMLWGRSLRSPHPHARIVRIDTSAAKALPGVHAVITGADLPGHLFGRSLRDVPVLAKDRVRYVGERVAAVAADDEDIAQQALDLIEVEYEELPAVSDVLEAMKPDAPILHPDYNDYEGVRNKLDQPSNAYVRQVFEKGDLEKGFAEADQVFEHSYYSQVQHGAYMEPQAIVAWDDKETGTAQVWACSKAPYRVREPYASSMGLAEDRLVMHPIFVGGDFGSKTSPASLPIAYYLSQVTGRPVKIVHDYVEELMFGNPNQLMIYRLRTGVKNDGTITAHHVEHIVNCGAYAGYKPSGVMGSSIQAAGAYKCDNVRVESANVYTNTLPGQILRAPGEPQAVFALESHMDEVSRAIGIDPVEFRLKNMVESGEEMAAGETLDYVRVKDTIRAAVQAAGYHDPKPPMVGRGIAVGDRGQGGGQAHARYTLNPDGSLTIGTPVFDQGTGSYTTLYQVAEEELGIRFDGFHVDVWDTSSVPFDAGLGGSIQSRLASTVGFEAAQELKKALIGFVAVQMGWPEAELRLQGEEVWRTDIEEKVNWRDLLRQTGESVSGQAHINENIRGHFTSFCVQTAEVEVDPETGAVKLRKLVTAHDVGQVLNPIGHQGQINGALMQGIGFAMMEELKVEEGRVLTGSFGDYKIPTMADIPELQTVLLEGEVGSGPYAVKGIGEVPMVPTAAAIANAIQDACGARVRDLPITAEKVYRELQKQ